MNLLNLSENQTKNIVLIFKAVENPRVIAVVPVHWFSYDRGLRVNVNVDSESHGYYTMALRHVVESRKKVQFQIVREKTEEKQIEIPQGVPEGCFLHPHLVYNKHTRKYDFTGKFEVHKDFTCRYERRRHIEKLVAINKKAKELQAAGLDRKTAVKVAMKCGCHT